MPTNFHLDSGESKILTVHFVPADSGYTYCKFTFENDICQTEYIASGGFKGKKPRIRTLKLIRPNGAEVFVAGSDTVITWEGVSPLETVRIDYSTNKGSNWISICDTATGLHYNWRVPNTPSNLCLARVTARANEKPMPCFDHDLFICDQVWMACNLDVDTYRNGDPIPQVTNDYEWANLTTGAWCYYNNDPALGEMYGKLYNWYAVNDPRGLAPAGWHVPTRSDWLELENCLNVDEAGGKLKSTGTIEDGDGLWLSPNTAATNEQGFSALPGGLRNPSTGNYSGIGFNGFWWSSSEYNDLSGWTFVLFYNSSQSGMTDFFKKSGIFVRCVRDN